MWNWIKSLFKKEETKTPVKTSVDTGVINSIDLKHYSIAEGMLGTKEIKGAKHNSKIQAMYKMVVGYVMADETPWCAAFVNYCLQTAGIKGTGSLAARSFMKFGASVIDIAPAKGDVLIFWRGSKNSWKGHVGFYAGETETHYIVLGGNQGDMVCFKEYPKSRLLDRRRVYLEDVNTTIPKPPVKGWLDSYDDIITHGIENYLGNLKNYREDPVFWCAFFRALAASESGLDPFDMYWEKTLGKPKGYDPITGRKYLSEGLLQLSYSDHQYYGCDFNWEVDMNKHESDTTKTIFDPKKNLECGMIILDKLVAKHGRLVFNSGHYWAVLKSKNKRHKDFLYYWNMYKKLYNVREDV